MPSVENLKVLIALLPGFLSQRIGHYFGTQYKPSDINIVVSALIFALINFFISIPICKIFKVEREKNNGINLWFLFTILIVSLATGVGWALVDRNDILHKVGLTTKITQAHLWTKIFQTNAEDEKWKAAVKVTLQDNKVYIGWGRYWSEQQEENNILFLKPAFVLYPNGRCSKVEGPGVMLFEKEMKYMEFISVPSGAKHPCNVQDN